MEYKILIKQ